MKISATYTLFVLVLALLVLSACGTPAPASTATPAGPVGDSAQGQVKFASTCSACHGQDAKGISGMGKDLTTSEFAKGLSDADLITFITKGRDASDPLNTTGVQMPPRGGNPALTDQDLADIVAYIRTLQH